MGKSSAYRWYAQLHDLFRAAVEKYQGGQRDAGTYFTAGETAYLAGIGQTPQEIYDFAEDHARGGDPDWETVLLISAARRDFLLDAQGGVMSTRVIAMEDLPAKEATLEGIAWLPRLIQKARAKLRGEMPADLMYDCGGDRRFFEEYGLHPADFLRVAWAADGDAQKILRYVRG
jgi:hypothetical protein